MSVAMNMIVKALVMKSFALSHIRRTTEMKDGNLYVGSSITNGTASPLKNVLLRIRAAIIPTIHRPISRL